MTDVRKESASAQRNRSAPPATSAPSERVFYVGGLTISKRRSSVQPQHASELIFLHDSWRLAEECEKEFEKKN